MDTICKYVLVFGLITSSTMAAAQTASISLPQIGIKDNYVQYEMTTRDGFTIYLREWLKPNDGSPPLSRRHSTDTQALLMMPGFPHTSMLVWERQVNDPKLSQNYRMVTMETRGHGDSSKPILNVDFAAQRWADDIQDAILLLDLHNTVLMSHSFSGTALVEYLGAYGDTNLGGVILTSSFTKLDLTNQTHQNFSAEVFDPGFTQAPSLLGATNDLGDYYRTNIDFGNLSFFKIDDAYKNRITMTDMMVPPATRLAMFFPPAPVDNVVLAAVSVPAMVVHAKDNCALLPKAATCNKSKDMLIQLQHALNNFNLLKTNSRSATLRIMDRVGHFPQAEDSETYNTNLIEFLKSL